MSLEQTCEPRRKKAKLDDSDAATDKTSLCQVPELERALDNNQPMLVLDIAQKIVTTTGLDQKLSMRILKYVFQMRNKNPLTRLNDYSACSRSNKMTPKAVDQYLSNQTIFCRSRSIDGFLDVARLLLRHQTIDLKTIIEGVEILHQIIAAGDMALATLLVQADIDVNARDPVNSRTLLHAVLRSHNIESNDKREEFVRLLLDRGGDVNARCAKGRSVVYTAITHGRCSSQLVEELLKRGADVETREGGNMLWTAVEEGQNEIAAMLVRSGARLNLVEPRDHHTILQAVLRSHKIVNNAKREELVRLIMDRGADVNTRNDNGYSVLDDAIRHRHCSFRLVEELLERGARLGTFKSGEHLWAAIEEGHEDMAAKLVRSGVDLSVGRHEDGGTTPLHAVLRSTKILNNAKREQIVQLMLGRGADVDAYDNTGTVLGDAITHSHCSSQLVEEILSYGALPFLEDIRLAAQCKPRLLPKLVEQRVPDEETRNKRVVLAIELLIVNQYAAERMADVTWAVKEILRLGVPASILENQWGEQPCSLLNLALKAEKRDAVKLLLKYGADPHQKNDFGYTPLFQATAFEDSEISRWLIKKGASVHARNDDGWSPIYGACLHESLRNINLLLDLGADINVVDSNGYTPFHSMDVAKLSDAGHLVIEYFGFLIAKGEMVSDKDMANVNKYSHGRSHYQECIKEIEKMKVTNVCSGMPYFSLLFKNTYSTLQRMKNSALVSNFKESRNNLSDLFPLYHNMLLHSFEIAKMRYKLFRTELLHVRKAFEGFLPDLLIKKMAHYVTLETIKQYQHNYYMSLHANL